MLQLYGIGKFSAVAWDINSRFSSTLTIHLIVHRLQPEMGPEPIAVIGMGCRFSGQASSIDGFWDMLLRGRTGHCKVPSSRYEPSGWHHPSHDRKGAINHDSGFFLEEDPSRFDAPFFSITAKEAAGMDPAQRLLLEVAYEAFENGGMPIETLSGSRTAVFSGCMTNDYELLSTSDIYDMPHNSATGNGRTMLANRLSWFFDLRGPSVMLDTACSSSLTALHLATQALHASECDMALITGASLILHPNFTQRLSYMHMLSADGISHSFDKKANGYGRGEGLGAVLLKPLSRALEDKDAIRAVIRATGTNQDGRTPGITMPNRAAQADLIRTVYGSSSLSMRATTYFEAHGTGTEIGDPNELSAIGDTLGAARSIDDMPIYVGSVKSNIGHTEGAAGVASLIKAVLCVEKGFLVPNAGFSQINPKIHLNEWRLRLSDETIHWPPHLPRRVSINSFGFGGSNAHAIIESASEYFGSSRKVTATSEEKIPQVIVFSTSDKDGIDRIIRKWTPFLHTLSDAGNGESLRDIAHTLGTRRSQLAFRSFAVADSVTELLDALNQGLPHFSRASRTSHANLAFIFTGQGAQWAGMGRSLLRVPIFAQSVKRSQQLLSSLGCTWELVEEIEADGASSHINQPDRSQSICCALQIALVDLLASWGVHPKATVGHSSGEIGAAYAAGFLTHEDAIRVAYFRGILSLRLSQNGRRGGMLAAGISAANAQEYINTMPLGSVVIACVNSPQSVTLSGDTDRIEQLEKLIQADKLFARKLRVQTAYHSPHMYDLADEYKEALQCILPQEGRQGTIAMFSSVTTERVHAKDLGAAYWVQNMVSTVEFASAVSKLATMAEARKGRRRLVPVKWGAFLEIGPHEALKGPFTQTLHSVDGSLAALPYQGLIQRDTDAVKTALQAAGLLWSLGTTIDIAAVNSSISCSTPGLVTDLPSYPWNHKSSFWHEPVASARLWRRKEPRHDLLGVPWEYQNDIEPRWRNFLRVSEMPWLSDHVVAGSIIFPAAGMVALVAEAVRQLASSQEILKGIEFNDLSFLQGVVIPDDERGLEIVLHVAPHHGVRGWYEFGLFSLPKGASWIKHAVGTFVMHHDYQGIPISTRDWSRTTEHFSNMEDAVSETEAEAVYEWLSKTGGVSLGPTFRSISRALFCKSQPRLWIEGVVPDTKRLMSHERESAYFMHPTSLDALFQAAVLSCSGGLGNQNANIPVGVEKLYLPTDIDFQAGDRFNIYTTTRSQDAGGLRSDSMASDASWSRPTVLLQGIRLGRVPIAKKSAGATDQSQISHYSSISWIEHPRFSKWDAVGGQTGNDHLSEWLQRICHTCGDVRALIIAQPDQSSRVIKAVQPLMPAKCHRSCLQELTVVLLGTDALTQAQTVAVQELLPSAQVLQIATLQNLSSALADEKSFDVVLVDTPSIRTAADIETNLATFSSIAQSDGWLALHTSAAESDILSHVEKSSTWDVGNLVGKTIISLLELEHPWVSSWTAESMAQFQALLDANYVLWISPSTASAKDAGAAAFGATTGLLRTLRNENRGVILPQLQFETLKAGDEHLFAQSILHVMQLTLSPVNRSSHDQEFRFQDGRILVPRVIAAEQVDKAMDTLLYGPQPILGHLCNDGRPLRLQRDPQDTQRGHWVEDSDLVAPLPNDQVEVQVQLQTIALPDESSGKTPEAGINALEAVGTIKALGGAATADFAVGDTVVLLKPGSELEIALATRVRVPISAIARLPTGLTLEQSASVPLAYTLAFTSLFDTARLGPHDCFLVVGPLSQTLRAILNCALMVPGMQVYVATTTVVDADEVISQYPVPPQRVMCVDGALHTTIGHLSGGKGVSAVVSCIGGSTGRLAAQSLRLGGHYVDISGDMTPAALPNSFLEKGCTFSYLNLNILFKEQADQVYSTFRRAMAAVCSQHCLHPTSVFPVAEWTDAKDHAHNTGSRATINLTVPGDVLIEPALPMDDVYLPREHTFILAGGIGTLGLASASTLVENGARHLVFLSRSGVIQDAFRPAIYKLTSQGCQIDVIRCDISMENNVRKLVAQVRENKWQVKGVLQCATVLKDAMFEKLTFEDWKLSTEAKISGTLNLHRLLADEELDFFVTLSSVASVVGNIGQSNYAAGNAFMDELMNWRRAHGLPGNSINIGLVPDASGVGDVTESPEQRRRRYSHLEGTEILTHELQTLLRLILHRQVPVPAQIIAGLTDNLSREGGASWHYDRKFDHRILPLPANTGTGSVKTSSLLKRAGSIDEAIHVVVQGLQEYLASAMAASSDSIDPELPLSALGVDSLKAVEVQNWVSREMGAELSSFEFLGSQPLRALSERIARESSYVTISKLENMW
ncbi:polyketide synthase [Penicillium digitatum]|nr:polyketide synthase [Penicillium digitatum]